MLMKGVGFEDMLAFQLCVTVALRSVPKEDFSVSFQKLHECCEKCVVLKGDYFESQYKGNLFICFDLFILRYQSLNFLDTPPI